MVQNDKLSERLQRSDTGFFEKMGVFLLGAVLAGGIAVGLGRTL